MNSALLEPIFNDGHKMAPKHDLLVKNELMSSPIFNQHPSLSPTNRLDSSEKDTNHTHSCSPEGSLTGSCYRPSKGTAAERKRPYPCSLCSSKFGSKMELEEHQNSHTGMKPFECDICHSRFNRRSTLWNHKRIHSDNKPFVCTVCQMKFKWKNSLKCHKEMHMRKNESNMSMDDLKNLTYATAAKKRNFHSIKGAYSDEGSTTTSDMMSYVHPSTSLLRSHDGRPDMDLRGNMLLNSSYPPPNDLLSSHNYANQLENSLLYSANNGAIDYLGNHSTTSPTSYASMGDVSLLRQYAVASPSSCRLSLSDSLNGLQNSVPFQSNQSPPVSNNLLNLHSNQQGESGQIDSAFNRFSLAQRYGNCQGLNMSSISIGSNGEPWNM
uniref:Zinc finger protein n=1 Tax=Rhabditophanes sp. KR3021 TaxID=114890 RepID=A0AC35UH93_9BILA